MGTRLIKYGTTTVVLGAMAAGTLLLAGREFEWPSRPPERKAHVKPASDPSDLPCFTVKPGGFIITIATGVVEAVQTEDVMSPVAGVLVTLAVLPDGTPVKKGALICEIDSSGFGAGRADPRAAGKHADEAVNLADAVERYPLHAPTDGRLQWARGGSRFGDPNQRFKPGDIVSKGRCVFQLYDDAGPMRVRTEVVEDVIDQFRPGMPARIRLKPFPERLFKGTVRDIAVLSNRNSYLSGPKFYDTLVSIDGGPPGPQSGMSAEVEFFVNDGDNLLSVPLEAVLSFYGKDLAAVKRSDGRFDWREITQGAHSLSHAEVKRGLQSGDCVSLKPAAVMRAQEDAKQVGSNKDSH